MIFRKFILIAALLAFTCPVQARTNGPLRLSPIGQIWNLKQQKLELLFNVVNESDRALAFSYVVHFKSRLGSGWKEQRTKRIGQQRSQLVRISLKPDYIRVGDYISSAVVLYGAGFWDFKDLREQYFEITEITETPDRQSQLDFTEKRPIKEDVRVPLSVMNRVAAKLTGREKQTLPREDRVARHRQPLESREGLPALRINEMTPAAGASEIPIESVISITCSEPLAPDSVSHDSFFLITASGKAKNRKIPGRITVKGTTIQFKPIRNLEPDTRYQAVLFNQIRSISDARALKTRSWFFKTRKKVAQAKVFGPEKHYLKVVLVSPRVRGINILTDTTVQLRLSGEIVPASVTEDSFHLSWKGGRVEATRTTVGDKITLKPKAPLKPETIYTVNATTDITDKTGKHLKKQIRWQFKTRKVIAYPEADDPNILIFSPSHEPVSYVKETTGVLKIGITAFSPLLHADVNGTEITIKPDTKAEFEIPYRLRSKTTPFEVTTFTKEGKASKKFVIHFGNKPKPKKPPFQLIALLSAANVDNINNEPADSENMVAASKMALTFVPQYEFRLGEVSVLRFKGILLRERYEKEEYQDRETSYTQFAVEWEQRKTFLGTFIAGVGWNAIRLNNGNFIGENENSTETFFSTAIKNRINKTDDWEIGLSYTNQNAAEDADNIDEETDGKEIAVKGSTRFTLSVFKNKLKAEASACDAIGKYQDYASASASYTLSLPLGDFTPSVGYTHKFKQMAIDNPIEDAQPEYTAGTRSAKIKYKLFKRTIFTLEHKSKSQVSNLADSNYTTNTVTLSMIQVF